MELPSRLSGSYNSSFSSVENRVAQSVEGLLHTAKPNKVLSTSLPTELSRSTSQRIDTSKLQETDLQLAVSTSSGDKEFDLQLEKSLEELREQLEQLQFKKRYSSVTIPGSVRYSTSAPKKGNELADRQLQMEQEKMQEGLDQTLKMIKEQLGMLSSERISMEKQMDDLTDGIHEARIQCHNQCRQKMYAARVRRVHSSTYGTSPRVPKRKNNTNYPEPIIPSEKKISSPTLLSPDSITSNPEYIVQGLEYITQGHRALSYTDSGYGSLHRRSKSSEFNKFNKIRTTSFTSTPNVSLSQGNEHNPTIPELPESPCFSQPTPSHKLSQRIKSNPTLHYVSHTTPRPHRSQSVSSSIVTPMISITSSPDLSTRRKTDSKPYSVSHRNSLPESVMNKIIEADTASISDTLSQASLSQTEEGSPKSMGSTVIVRRSSLTGQMEHIRRPRKRNSLNGATETTVIKEKRPISTSVFNLTGSEYRVLNTGYKHNRRSRVILPNSIETTV